MWRLNVNNDVNSYLDQMRQASKRASYKEKGTEGENAVRAVLLSLQDTSNIIFYSSFEYPYSSDRNGKNYTGNIFFSEGKYTEITDKKGLHDEIDLLYITPYRIFAIEVKSYHARKLRAYDHWMDREGVPMEKSPIAQAEKHARMLYHAIYEYIPNGDPKYIVPLCVFVDRCTFIDDRSPAMKEYIPCTILNNLKKTIVSLNKPLEYQIDLDSLHQRLENIKRSGELIGG